VVKFAIAGIAANNTSSDQLSTAGYWTIRENESTPCVITNVMTLLMLRLNLFSGQWPEDCQA